MAVKAFQAESKRLLDMMIHSIYTQKEIFLRELISNASDAIDKIYYKALTDTQLTFDKDNYYIQLSADKDARTLTITDTGIGMTAEELENNLGVIAKSGSLAFKSENTAQDGHDIIGQFGVGFYSAFMVADQVTVVSKALGSDTAYRWHSEGAEGYTIEPLSADESASVATGTTITLHIKPNSDDDSYDDYLQEYRLRQIVKKYSDFIRYPIKMDVTRSELKEGSEDEYEQVTREEVLNSLVPIWKKNKAELTDEDYTAFYHEKRYGFDEPLKHIHVSADGAISYQAILYIPESTPFDYYSREFEKGLELYSNGVLIMNKCADLLPDFFSFVRGMVDSSDLSLNISRELLQHDRQLKLIAKNIQSKIKSTLLALLKDEREKYETFYKAFGRQLKFGVYNDYGQHKDVLKDLLLFNSSSEGKLVSLDEYVARMPEEQKYIYYATGDNVSRIEKLPQVELVRDRGFEVLYLTEDIDEFAIKVLLKHSDKDFRSVAAGDLGFEVDEQEKAQQEAAAAEHKDLFAALGEQLSGKVKSVRASQRLKSHAVCLTAEGEISIEMEKVLRAMPGSEGVQADKVLEINMNHPVFAKLQDAFASDKEKLAVYASVLYNQALLIEGLPLEDPVEYTNHVIQVMV